jgi:hypothetical protein
LPSRDLGASLLVAGDLIASGDFMASGDFIASPLVSGDFIASGDFMASGEVETPVVGGAAESQATRLVPKERLATTNNAFQFKIIIIYPHTKNIDRGWPLQEL